jgi:hypothetical protein
MLPLAKIRAASAAKFAEDDANFLQYGYISGYPEFRKSLAKFLAEHYKRGECGASGWVRGLRLRGLVHRLTWRDGSRTSTQTSLKSSNPPMPGPILVQNLNEASLLVSILRGLWVQKWIRSTCSPPMASQAA